MQTGLQLPQQNPDGSGIATPDAGYSTPFPGTDGNLYIKLPSGVVVPLAVASGNAVVSMFEQTASVTVASSAAETTFVGAGVGSMTIKGGSVIVGTGFSLQAWGYHSGVSTPTIRIRIYVGSVVVLDTGVQNSGNSTAALWQLKANFRVVATGATGTVEGQGFYQELGGGVNNFPMQNTEGSATPPAILAPVGPIDFTADELIKATVQWGTSSSSNSFTCTNLSQWRSR